MDKFDAKIHVDNPPLDAAFLVGMKPSRRGRPKLDAPNVEVKIRLDASTAEHLRGTGPDGRRASTRCWVNSWRMAKFED